MGSNAVGSFLFPLSAIVDFPFALGKAQGTCLSFQNLWSEKGASMLTQRTIVVPSIVGYVPPKGYRICKIRELADGSYEVTLEPWALIS